MWVWRRDRLRRRCCGRRVERDHRRSHLAWRLGQRWAQALGVIIGSVGGAYKPIEPDPPYADAVVRCLIEKGYDVSGWQ